MARRKKSDAYDLPESQLTGDHADIKTYAELASWLATELDSGLEARGAIDQDIRYAWTLYEQGRTRGASGPWPNAADLTSPMAAEYVDALHARVMQTIFQEPLWIVEGWGDSAKRAPFLEEFHQRTQEDERLQAVLDEVLLRSWVEPAGVLEVGEGVDTRTTRSRMRVALEMDPATGLPLLDVDGAPAYQRTEAGAFVEVTDETQPSAEIEVDQDEPVRTGPEYDVIPYLDFLTLPSHARQGSQIWGYAKRFYRRVAELKARAKKGLYGVQAVDDLGTENERDTTSQEAPAGRLVPSQQGPTAEKELWEVQFLADLNGEGERWYRATIHKDKRLLLRLHVDDRTTRYIRFVPFRKPGSIDGYSLIGHKLITVIEEDTAVRNMRADKAALSIGAPILRESGALFDPAEQRWGPGAIIDVRNKGELTQMPIADVPPSMNVWKQDIRQDADRLIGQNDTSLGTQTGEHRTLGEVRLRTGYAEVRMDLLVKRLKEPLEELFQARHNIWKRTLASRAEGMPMPHSMALGLESRGIPVDSVSGDQNITADMLEGRFWGKPRGSVESADVGAQQGYFNQFMATMANLSKVNPMIAQLLQTQSAAKSIIEQALRVNKWPDKQAFLGSEAQSEMAQAEQQRKMMADPKMQFLRQMIEAGPGAGPPGAPQGPPPGMPPMPPGGVQ